MLTSLPDAGAVREVALGAAGIVTGECPGRLLVDTSTTSPAEARNLANDLDPHGVAFLDAPVSGGVTGAEIGSARDHDRRLPGEHRAGAAGARLPRQGRRALWLHRRRPGHEGLQSACGDGDARIGRRGIGPGAGLRARSMARSRGPHGWIRGEPDTLDIQAPRMLRHDFEPGGRARPPEGHCDHRVDCIRSGPRLTRLQGDSSPDRGADQSGGGDLDNSALITLIEPTPTGG